MEYYNPLCNFVYQFTGNHEHAEDVVQEVFIHLWENRKKLDVPSNLSAYLFQAVKNKSLEILRKKKIEKKHLDQISGNWMSSNDDLSALASKYHMIEQINKSVRQLPPKCQKVFVLHKQNGLTYKEIADHLELSVKTVENHMIKAMKLLRDAIYKSKQV